MFYLDSLLILNIWLVFHTYSNNYFKIKFDKISWPNCLKFVKIVLQTTNLGAFQKFQMQIWLLLNLFWRDIALLIVLIFVLIFLFRMRNLGRFRVWELYHFYLPAPMVAPLKYLYLYLYSEKAIQKISAAFILTNLANIPVYVFLTKCQIEEHFGC